MVMEEVYFSLVIFLMCVTTKKSCCLTIINISIIFTRLLLQAKYTSNFSHLAFTFLSQDQGWKYKIVMHKNFFF